MRLVRKHKFRQHIFVASNSDWVLMLHNGTAIDIEGRYQDVFHMVLRRTLRVLRSQSSGVVGICI